MAHYLVTGGAGFIGSHMVDHLLENNHQVRVLDDLSSGNKENLAHVSSKIEFVQADLRDRAAVTKACEGIEYIIHLAAWRSVPKSMADPVGYMDVNVMGTTHLLDAAVKTKVKRTVCISSSSVYGETKKVPMSEDQPTLPISPYAASKLIDEVLCGLFYRAFGLETVAIRYFNVFGPRQSLESEYAVVVPKFIQCLLANESPPVYGDGKQSRDFTYVKNVVEASVKASQTEGIAGEVFNIALGEETSVLELLEQLNQVMGLTIKAAFKPPRPGDVLRTFADSSKAERLLKWKGSVSFSEGLRQTVQWFKANPPKVSN